MSPNTADTRHLYAQLADDLRREIERGDYPPGTAIPSEAELRERSGMSRDTVRKALAQLTNEGLLTGGQGRTRQVRRYAPLRWVLSHFESRTQYETSGGPYGDAWSTEVHKQGRKASETIELGIVVPPVRVAELLGLKPGVDIAVLRKRVRYVDDRPYQIADSYFPEPLVRGTPLMEPHSVSAPGGLLASIGHPQVRYMDEIVVRMPTRVESDRLDLPGATPIAEVTRTGYDSDGATLRVMVNVTPGDRNVLVYEVDAK